MDNHQKIIWDEQDDGGFCAEHSGYTICVYPALCWNGNTPCVFIKDALKYESRSPIYRSDCISVEDGKILAIKWIENAKTTL